MVSKTFSPGTIIDHAWLNSVDHVVFGAREIATGDGVTDDTLAITEADIYAASNAEALVVPAGTYLISSSYIFTAPVAMLPGAKFKTTSSSVYLKFSAGFFADIFECLDTDGPTQFLSTEKIFPQWFGSCGGASEDSSVALTRAFKACRASFGSSLDYTDKTYGCRTVWFTSGTYKCKNVPVYCGTNIDGEWGGSPYGPSIMQIDYNDPALRFVPKNYALDGTVLNTSVGQNHIQNIRLGNLVPSSSFDGEPICKFMSPSQATTYLGIAGDTAGTIGHIDTQFEKVWFKSGGVCIGADEGMLWVHISRCTFDVVYKAVHHSGSSYGMVRSYNNIYYGCLHGAIHNTSTDTVTGVRLDSHGDEFKAGSCFNGTADWRRAINYNPTTKVVGTFVRIHDAHFWKQTSLGATTTGTATGGASGTLIDSTKTWTTNQWLGGYVYITSGTGAGQSKYISSNNATTLTISGTWTTPPDATSIYYIEMLRLGGPVFIKNADRVEGSFDMYDPDCTNAQKAVALQDGIRFLNLKVNIISERLTDYTAGALVKLTQSTQTIAGGKLEVIATNTGPVTIPAALDSDYVVDSKLSIQGLKTAGSFTEKRGTNLATCDGQDLVGSASCAIGTLANGARSTAFNITVTGASVGDSVSFSPGGSLMGCGYNGYVSASNNVVFYAYNWTGISQAIGTMTITAYVTRAS